MKIEWCVPKKKAKKSDWRGSGLSKLLKASRGSVEASLDRQFGTPVVNPRKRKSQRRTDNGDVFR